MTKSFIVELNSDGPTEIVGSSYYPQPNPDDNDFKRNHRPYEVIIINNTEGSLIFLGSANAYYDDAGIILIPGAGVSLSLGSGDDLFAWSPDSVSVPVMILDGKGR